MSNGIYLYQLEQGKYSDKSECMIASLRFYTNKEFEDIFIEFKNKNDVYNIWSYASYLQDNFEFFWPTIISRINFNNFN